MDGLNKFKEYFADYTDNYVVIGGVACGLYADMFAQNPRVTHDIDTVLVVEALTHDFVVQFWHFVKDAGYKVQETSTGKHEHFRFRFPSSEDFPEQIELFSRDIGLLTTPEGARLTPIPMDEDLSSLSAILMNDAYYHYTISHCELVEGVHVAKPESLICLKCRAYVDLATRRAEGESIDSRKVNKHKRDVFRLVAMLAATQSFAVPYNLYQDILVFAEMVRSDMPNADMLKAIGIYNTTAEDVLQRLLNAYVKE